MPDSSEGTCPPREFLDPQGAAQELVDLIDRGALVDRYDLAQAEELLRGLAWDETDYPCVGQ
jgi:hypothetical protein